MINLTQYRETVQGREDYSIIIDDLMRSSYLLSVLPFAHTLGASGGSNFAYGYTRTTNEAEAGFRKVGEKYTDSDVQFKKFYAEIGILGGSYTIDRAIAKASKKNAIEQVERQNAKHIQAIKTTFHNAVINGDVDSSDKAVNGFDGLAKIMNDETQAAQVVTSTVDISSVAKVKENALAVTDEFDKCINKLNGPVDVILTNELGKRRLATVARELGKYTQLMTQFGQAYDCYGNAPIIDLGQTSGGKEVIPVKEDGTTDIYFVRFGADAFHGITIDGDLMDVKLPRFDILSDEQLRGVIEMYAGVVLKSTKGCTLLKDVKVQEVSEG